MYLTGFENNLPAMFCKHTLLSGLLNIEQMCFNIPKKNNVGALCYILFICVA